MDFLKAARKVGVVCLLSLPLQAWDSRTESGLQVGDGMHYQFTLLAGQMAQADGSNELGQFFPWVAKGSLTEMHELKAKAIDVADGQAVGLDLEAKRVQHRGTNAGTDNIQGWWSDSAAAYQNGNKSQAYFLLGIVLHMVEDMGVPAHANNVYHQGNLTEFDNFEFNATFNLSYILDGTRSILESSRINRGDPQFADPSRYYAFSRDWTHSDAPNYVDRSKYPKTRLWPFYSDGDEQLMRNRQARTTIVTYWCLRAALRAFSGAPNPN